jgi:hypothetical protein
LVWSHPHYLLAGHQYLGQGKLKLKLKKLQVEI